MKDGFVKVAACTPKIRVADPEYNSRQIIKCMNEGSEKGAGVIVFPELCISGYTCSDLFLQDKLIKSCMEALFRIIDASGALEALIFVGLPFENDGKLYNVAAVISSGKFLAIVPKRNIPNYGEFYEKRHFCAGPVEPKDITIRIPDIDESDSDTIVPFGLKAHASKYRVSGKLGLPFGDTSDNDDELQIPFGSDILFDLSSSVKNLKVGCEICEDAWVPSTPGTGHALNGATLLVNLSASNDIVGKDTYRRELISSTSARLVCGYAYASAGEGESTQDIVFGGHNIIAENGSILSENRLFENKIAYADIDIERIVHERRRMDTFGTDGTYRSDLTATQYRNISVSIGRSEVKLSRKFDRQPFVPSNKQERDLRCEQILDIQTYGLKKRYEHTGLSTAVIGVSGGLDSTLALIVTVRAFDLLGIDRSGIIAVTMPCFGTTDRTYQNACNLAKTLGVTLKEVNINRAVSIHFSDIGQDSDNHDVTYENSQARERTQVLMDIANMTGGLVIGTGDLSELALGWATYNGDHMSMYAVNVGVPKTLVRFLVEYYADNCDNTLLEKTLRDVLDTPVSPELIPPVDGEISQKTEDLVGPYELHDFFLYYMLRCGFEPGKIFRIASLSFKGVYDEDTILKWLRIFTKRFFAQQFKRSCLPDGPKVGSVAVSPRGDLRMPSDACSDIWLREIDALILKRSREINIR